MKLNFSKKTFQTTIFKFIIQVKSKRKKIANHRLTGCQFLSSKTDELRLDH